STYTLGGELPGGGMSRVFVATEASLGRKVVVKVLPPDLSAGVKVERFKREVQFLARLQHAHIVPILAAGGTEDLSFYVMPFMDGESLRSRIAREGGLPIGETLRILREVASALAFAHAKGIIHRDIKPDNVLLSGGAAMVTDFGVAKALSVSTGEAKVGGLTSLGMALGTPAYIAPEQATADPATDHRADIYSFGAMAYEMLSGSPPFAARSPQAMLAAHVTEAPRPISERRTPISPRLSSLVMACLEKLPAERPQSAGDLMARLDEISTTPESGSAVIGATPAYSLAGDSLHEPKPPASLTKSTLSPVSLRSLVAGGIIIALAALALGYLRSDDVPAASTATTDIAAPVAAGDRRSIAVLPLVNVGRAAGDEYFSDGMTDELANALSRMPGLRVASRTSAFAFKGAKGDAREIGRRLNVGTLLEGTVRRDGSRLRVQVRLTNASDGLSIWGQSYERTIQDVFAVQDSISRAVVDALQIELTRTEEAKLSRRGTNQPEANDLYHKGRFHVNRNSEPEIRQGLEYYRQALEKDPNYGRAWAGVAFAWIALADDFVAPRDAYPTAKLAAVRAIQSDSTLAEARAALGAVSLWFDWDFDAAERELREAIRLEPNGVYAYRYYGNALKAAGKFDSAMVIIRKARSLEPLSPGRTVSVALMHTTLREYDRAIAESKRAIELNPNYADA
ncbi:MAG: protein kinase, partial [Gemmatimonadaceae bacterium]|nr:protein kinase [Gemmatimonadaceae bacterium]